VDWVGGEALSFESGCSSSLTAMTEAGSGVVGRAIGGGIASVAAILKSGCFGRPSLDQVAVVVSRKRVRQLDRSLELYLLASPKACHLPT
jgi:hypothetical protein